MFINYKGTKVPVKTWEGESLGTHIAMDTETDFTPSYVVPELATIQAYNGKVAYLIRISDLRLFLNKHYSSKFIFQNASFDLDVISKELGSNSIVIDMISRQRVLDTAILYRLLHIGASGFPPEKYNLKLLSEKYLGIQMSKDSDIRTNFMQFKNVGLQDIPYEFVNYMMLDVVCTFHIWFELQNLASPMDKYNTLLTHHIQVKGDYALKQIHVNGIGFNLEKKDEWLMEANKKLEHYKEILATYGWVRGRKGNKEHLYSILEYFGIKDKLPLTDKGNISTSGDALAPFMSNIFVKTYLEFSELEKITTFCREVMSERIHPKYNLLVSTGRTSCSKPNFQQLPRVGGIREMFVPKKGHSFIITDYSAIELATLSQVLLKNYGSSVMADKINEGIDLHAYYASILHGISIDKVSKQQRQEAKAANFGFAGGLGIDTFKEFSAGYGLVLTSHEAQRMKDAWFAAYPEMRQYMQNEVGSVYTLTGRKRGCTTYCAEKNTPFQGLAADGAKIALFELVKEGFTVVGFVLDEIITEVPTHLAQELQLKQEEIMVSSMKKVVPDIDVSVESQITEAYTK